MLIERVGIDRRRRLADGVRVQQFGRGDIALASLLDHGRSDRLKIVFGDRGKERPPQLGDAPGVRITNAPRIPETMCKIGRAHV